MLDHVGLRVQDFPRALAFYRAALEPLGYRVMMEFPEAAGLGYKGKTDFWIMKSDRPQSAVLVAFTGSRQAVTAFHAAALAAGGSDNGGPGVRPDYHPNYFGAFILDPEGNNVEAVCHDAPGGARREATSTKRRVTRGTARRGASRKKPARKRPGRK
jgi:catechol 2,3-dioxygenase-like lactoylglutathione lyase family enzyme